MIKDINLVHIGPLTINFVVSWKQGSRSPYDCGANAKYYQDPYRPYKRNFWGKEIYDLTPKEIEEFKLGWDEEPAEKEWGR